MTGTACQRTTQIAHKSEDGDKAWEGIYFVRGIYPRIATTSFKALRYLALPADETEVRIWSGSEPTRDIALGAHENWHSAYYFAPVDQSNPDPEPRQLREPEKGWVNLWNQLDALEISTLPDPTDHAEWTVAIR